MLSCVGEAEPNDSKADEQAITSGRLLRLNAAAVDLNVKVLHQNGYSQPDPIVTLRHPGEDDIVFDASTRVSGDQRGRTERFIFDLLVALGRV